MATNVNIKFMDWFFTNPTKEIHFRELSRELKISTPWIHKLSRQNKETINQKKIGNMIMLSSNINHQFIIKKRLRNIEKIYESGIIEYIREKLDTPECIVLFGSFSKGEDIEKSDIDIAIRSSVVKNLDLKKYEKILEREIQLIYINNDMSEELMNNIINGIVLSGYLQWNHSKTS